MTTEQITQMEKLADLHEKGILTDEEFNAQKKRLLESSSVGGDGGGSGNAGGATFATMASNNFGNSTTGAHNVGQNVAATEKSEKSRLVALLLCLFLGGFGAHRFYVGRWKTAIAQIITVIGFGAGGVLGEDDFFVIFGGIWVLVDFIMIVVGKFKDKDNLYVLDWQTA